MIKVAIVEDHPLYQQGLIHTVETTEGVELFGAAGSVDEMERVGYDGCDVVILDLHLPDCEGAAAVMRVRERLDSVLVVSASDDRASVVEAIGAGARGYLPKSSTADEIARALTTIAAGGTYVSPVLAAYLLADSTRNEPPRPDDLTNREREVLSLLAEGETDADIAERLYISIRTVRSHLDRIRDKTGRRRRADLTRLAYEQGIVPDGA